jgi:hypothetical protein
MTRERCEVPAAAGRSRRVLRRSADRGEHAVTPGHSDSLVRWRADPREGRGPNQ